MPKTARPLAHAEQANDARSPNADAIAEARNLKPTPVSSQSKGSQSKRSGAKLSPSKASPSLRAPQLAETKAALSQVKKHAPPLLIGAGIGAAVALSVVALRTRERPPTLALFAGPNSTFFSALVKTAAFAVERTVSRGSLASLVARAVAKAVA